MLFQLCFFRTGNKVILDSFWCFLACHKSKKLMDSNPFSSLPFSSSSSPFLPSSPSLSFPHALPPSPSPLPLPPLSLLASLPISYTSTILPAPNAPSINQLLLLPKVSASYHFLVPSCLYVSPEWTSIVSNTFSSEL